MNLKTLFLPIGLLIAFIFGLLIPAPGRFIQDFEFQSIKIAHIIIFIIFVISGYQLKLKEFSPSKKMLFTLIIGAFINLLIAPFLTYHLTTIYPKNEAFTIGLIAMTCVPPSLVSGIIITEVAKGNTLWAIIFTISINLLGIFVIPFTFGYFVGLGTDNIIEPFALLKKLFILVFIPSLLGLALKKWKADVKNVFISYFQPMGIIIIVYATVSKGHDSIIKLNFSDFMYILLAVNLIHISLLLISLTYGKIIRLNKYDLLGMIFVVSQKTLPISLAIMVSFSAMHPKADYILSNGSIVCLLFHLSQIFLDSFIAGKCRPKEN